MANLVQIMNWFTEASRSATANTHQVVAHITTALSIGKTVLDVSHHFYSMFSASLIMCIY